MPLLSCILFFPLLAAAVLLLIPGRRERTIRLLANVLALAELGLSLCLLPGFRYSGGLEFVERASWIPSLGVQYLIGVDGISLLFVLLTTLMTWLAILSAWSSIERRVKEFYILMLILETGMIGVFVAMDFFLFFVFWEVVLAPMYFIIGIWGSERRLYAAIKFFLYTLLGSVLMLLGAILLFLEYDRQFGVYSFEIAEWMKLQLAPGIEQLVFWAFFLGFAIKVPMFPFHTWLPDAHVEAPTAGSVILAAILLKMGTYGFVRFSLPLLPRASAAPLIVQALVALSLIAIIYGAMVSLMQRDWKKLVAYSSVSHLGFCTLGIFSLNHAGLAGSLLQQINHGISTGMLFLTVGVVYDRMHRKEIAAYGGLAQVMPRFAVIFAVAAFSSAGLPLLNGFIGEFTILQGAFQARPTWAAVAALGIVLGAAYLLWLYQRTMMGELKPDNARMRDLNLREILVFTPLVILVFWIGVYPKPFFDILHRPVALIVERVHAGAQQAASTGPIDSQQ
jgi:NADH-quinone oxidoreductase subunit M